MAVPAHSEILDCATAQEWEAWLEVPAGRAGRLRRDGLAEIAAARADGRWSAADEPQRSMDPPLIWSPPWWPTVAIGRRLSNLTLELSKTMSNSASAVRQ